MTGQQKIYRLEQKKMDKKNRAELLRSVRQFQKDLYTHNWNITAEGRQDGEETFQVIMAKNLPKLISDTSNILIQIDEYIQSNHYINGKYLTKEAQVLSKV